MEEEDRPTVMPRSTAEFKQSWMKMKEKTSSRTLHFGHFKAACKNQSNLMAHYVLAEIPLRTGYSLQCWREATNVMILKEEGNHKLEKL